jgi:DNA-directed RNA polymerase subunit RPC12/RpoP
MVDVYESLTIALIAVLAAASTVAIFVGLLGMAGHFFILRCAACHHPTVSSANRPRQSCPRCRHPVLLHPLRAVHHPSTAGSRAHVGNAVSIGAARSETGSRQSFPRTGNRSEHFG